MRNSVRAMLAATTIAASTLTGIGSAAAASATADYSNCENGFFCAWVDAYYQGVQGSFVTGQPSLTRQGLDLNISSVENQDDVDWCIYAGKNYTGEYRRIKVDQSVGFLGDPAWNFNDKTRSMRPCPSTFDEGH